MLMSGGFAEVRPDRSSFSGIGGRMDGSQVAISLQHPMPCVDGTGLVGRLCCFSLTAVPNQHPNDPRNVWGLGPSWTFFLPDSKISTIIYPYILWLDHLGIALYSLHTHIPFLLISLLSGHTTIDHFDILFQRRTHWVFWPISFIKDYLTEFRMNDKPHYLIIG